MIRNAVQHSENVRNSLVLNYEIIYKGVILPHYHYADLLCGLCGLG
jgi:hypothetical protein